jgi:hypothetical protein
MRHRLDANIHSYVGCVEADHREVSGVRCQALGIAREASGGFAHLIPDA